MSFIGESRKDYKSPWNHFVCLDVEDCRLLLPALQATVKKLEKLKLKYEDLHEGGEMTQRQETAMMQAIESYDKASFVLNDVEEFIKLKVQ